MSDDLGAIQTTLVAYCHRVDSGTAEEVAELFTEDAVLQPYYDGDYDVHGRDGVREWYAFYLQTMSDTVNNLRHSVDTASIEIDGDFANSECYLTATFTMKKDNLTFQAQGSYIDTLIRSGDAWLIQSRRIEVRHINCLGEPIERMRPMGFPGASR